MPNIKPHHFKIGGNVKATLVVVLSILSFPAFAKTQFCYVNAKRTVTGILSLQENRNDLGVELLKYGSYLADGERFEWYELQGVYLKSGKKTGLLPQTYSRVEFDANHDKCVLASYSLPLAN